MGLEVKIPASLDEESSITRLDDKTFAVNLSPSFCIGTVPNGGYVATIFLRVASAYLSPKCQPDTIAAHWEFLSRTQAGPAILLVEEVKPGRSMSVLHVSLYQGGGLLARHPWISPSSPDAKGGSQRVVSAYLTNRLIEAEQGPTLHSGWSLQPELPPVADFAKLPLGQDANWEPLTIRRLWNVAATQQLQYFGLRQETEKVKPTASLSLWVRLANGERFTNPSLGFAIDATPAMVPELYRQRGPGAPIPEGGFPYNKAYWYPTLAMNLDVKKALPPGGEEWLLVHAHVKLIQNGRSDAEVLLFDTKGDLVALSHHVFMIVDSTRNTATREPAKKVNKI